MQLAGQRRSLLRIALITAALAVGGCRSLKPGPPAAVGTNTSKPVCTAGGICVDERFRQFYERHGGLIGEPIAAPSVYRDRPVQYFEAGRLEYVAEYPESYAVGLAYLAEELCGRQPPLHYRSIPSSGETQARYYAETGHSLREGFLRFVEANGGVAVFGPPISEARTVGKEMVQDFVRVQVRRGADGEFRLAPLGRLVSGGGEIPAGLCPLFPADDPDAEAGE